MASLLLLLTKGGAASTEDIANSTSCHLRAVPYRQQYGHQLSCCKPPFQRLLEPAWVSNLGLQACSILTPSPTSTFFPLASPSPGIACHSQAVTAAAAWLPPGVMQ